MLTIKLKDYSLSTSVHTQHITIDGRQVEIRKEDGDILINGQLLFPAKKPKFIQLLNPRSERWVKIDRTKGTIVSHKKSPGPYKNIPIHTK